MSNIKLGGVLVSSKAIEEMMEQDTPQNAQFRKQFKTTMQQIEEFKNDVDQKEFHRRIRIAFYVLFIQGMEEGRKLLRAEASKN